MASASRFAQKVCLITGGTAGIGLAIATRMAQEGGHVVICSRRQKNVDAAVAQIQAVIAEAGATGSVTGLAANVGSKPHRDALLRLVGEKFGRLDVLVPNAAVSTHFGKQFSISERAYDKLFAMNVKATFFLIKESLDLMRAAGRGTNICIVSSYTGQTPDYTFGVYGSTKATLDNMVKWMRDELRGDGIRVTGVAPGLIKTEFSSVLWKGNEAMPQDMMATTDQISGVVAMLCSYDGSVINGEVI